MNASQHLVASCAAMVALVFLVGIRMFLVRLSELREKRISLQAVATSAQAASRYSAVQAADNFRNLFEVPTLFYALAAVAIGSGHTPAWLVQTAWLYVVLRFVHSLIQCTYNNVGHRFAVFAASFLLLVVMWSAFLVSYASRSAG